MGASRDPESPRALVLAGETAVGKSAVALALALRGPSSVISLDARQVYRGMDVGTAKPTAEECARVPHRGIDERDPDDPWTAGQAGQDGRRWVEEAREEGRWPIVVAGSGLYVQAFLAGLDRGPADPESRAAWEARLEAEGPAALVDELVRRDPELASRTDLDNPRRVMRALEWLDAGVESGDRLEDRPPAYPVVAVRVTMERSALVSRIDARVDRMFEMGLVDETRMLGDRWGGPVLDRLPTVGYDQVRDHLANGTPLAEAVESVKVATRRFARRQTTWFRKYGGFHIEERDPGETPDAVADRVLRHWESRTGSTPWGR